MSVPVPCQTVKIVYAGQARGAGTPEFGVSQLKLERGQRQELVVSMRSAGMSTRAIGTALGVSHMTAERDAAGVTDVPPAPVVGLDGKTYTPPDPKPEYEPSGMDEFAAADDEVVEGEVAEPEGCRVTDPLVHLTGVLDRLESLSADWLRSPEVPEG